MPDSEDLVLVFMPSLVATLLAAERDKGSPLTEDEVIDIRDNAEVVASPADVAMHVEEERGYRDIDPEDCWLQWQDVRSDLGEE